MWQRFLGRLPPDFRKAIDRLLEVEDGDRYSTLSQFKQYPPGATPAAILSYLERFDLLRSMGVERIDVSDLNTKIVEQLADLGYHYGARDLRRFTPAKRYAERGGAGPLLSAIDVSRKLEAGELDQSAAGESRAPA